MIKMVSTLNGGAIYANEEQAHLLLGTFVPADGEVVPEPPQCEGEKTYEVTKVAEQPAASSQVPEAENANERVSNPNGTASDETAQKQKPLSQMNKTELADYAEARGVDLAGCSTKQDMLDAIAEAE